MDHSTNWHLVVHKICIFLCSTKYILFFCWNCNSKNIRALAKLEVLKFRLIYRYFYLQFLKVLSSCCHSKQGLLTDFWFLLNSLEEVHKPAYLLWTWILILMQLIMFLLCDSLFSRDFFKRCMVLISVVVCCSLSYFDIIMCRLLYL